MYKVFGGWETILRVKICMSKRKNKIYFVKAFVSEKIVSKFEKLLTILESG